LRAVTAEELTWLVAACADGPVHIHIAEQSREVDACLAWSGERPVQWLLGHAPVDARWCLVHATHVDSSEMADVIQAGAVVGLCPITEANLGDGLFPARAFLERGGVFGVGSDSNVLIDAAEELRLLEYGQRLSSRARNRMAHAGRTTGRTLFEAALTGGCQALGAAAGLKVGAPADFVALDLRNPAFVGRDRDALLDAWLFAARTPAVRHVWIGGVKVVDEGRHAQRARIQARYRKTLAKLLR
jgi:formiminoglutamate deiminase